MREGTRKFIGNGIALSLAALLLRTVSVSFGAYVSGQIGAEGMGLYSLVMSIYTLAVTFATSGVQLAVTRLVSEALGRGEDGGARAALRTALGYAAVCGALSATVLFLGAPFFGEHILGDGRAVPALRLLSAALLPIALSSVFSGYFTAVRRPSRSAAVSVAEQGVRILFTVWLLGALLPAGLTYACLALVGGSAIAEMLSAAVLGLLYLFDKRRLARTARGEGRGRLRPLLRITLPIAASSYIRSALVSAEHILIPRALTGGGASREETLGAYGTLSGMALPIALYPMAVLSSFAGLLVPEVAEGSARGDVAGNRRLCERALMLALWFGMAVGGVISAFATPLSRAVYGTDAPGRYLALLGPVIPVMYLDHVTDVMLKGLGRQVYAMVVNILDSVGSILLVLLLLPRLGAIGYVGVIALAEVFNFALSIAGLSGALPFRFPLLRGALYPAAAILTAVTLSRLLIPVTGVGTLLLAILFSLLCYGAVLALLLFLERLCLPLDKGRVFGYNRNAPHGAIREGRSAEWKAAASQGIANCRAVRQGRASGS